MPAAIVDRWIAPIINYRRRRPPKAKKQLYDRLTVEMVEMALGLQEADHRLDGGAASRWITFLRARPALMQLARL